MSNLNELLNKTMAMVKDSSLRLDVDDDYIPCISQAVGRYSKHRPDTLVADVTGTGGHDYDFPTGWVEGFSAVQAIEYPVGNVPETLLEAEDFSTYQTTTGRKLRLITIAPPSGSTFRVTFTIPRTEVTIPEVDVDALCSLSAALCLERLANIYLQTGDPTIGADSVDYRSRSQEAASRAKRLAQIYKDHLGIREEDVAPAASAVTDLDLRYPGGADRLTHPRWTRRTR